MEITDTSWVNFKSNNGVLTIFLLVISDNHHHMVVYECSPISYESEREARSVILLLIGGTDEGRRTW